MTLTSPGPTLVLAALLAIAPARAQTPAPQPAPAGARPKLVVLVVIDQFRADYVDMYSHQWTKGLRRLLDAGAFFTEAAFPYAATYTCAGHATIGTGTYPSVHGMSGNDYYDRTLRRLTACASDPGVTSLPFGGATGHERHSARALLVPTFAEELRRQSPRPMRIVSIGQKPRTPIAMAGRGGPDTVIVWEEDDGTWATSDAFTRTAWPDVDAFVRARPIAADYGAVWTPLLPPSALLYTDAAPGEGRPATWSRMFPHPLISRTGMPDNEYVSAWERSPRNDAFLTDLAISLLQGRNLGRGAATDFLALSLPCLDHNGHEFGPRSHEVQDILARLDVNLGRLLDALDRHVGPNYVVGLSSDHGVAPIPEQITAEGGDAGRISTTALRDAVNAAVDKVLGVKGQHVAAIYEQQIALIPGEVDVLRMKPGGFAAVKAAIGGVRGVRVAFSADDIISGAESSDPDIRAWRLSYVPGRSGDFLFTLRRNWIVRSGSGTTHGSANDYDQRVPLILFGPAIRAGRYTVAASPADLAPTFASLTGVKLPRAQGRALTEAIVR